MKQLKSLLAKRFEKRAPEIDFDSAPTFLLVGSLTGVNKKDAWQYMRGIATGNTTAPEMMRINAMEHDGRWWYEIHQGGPGYSILPKVIEALAEEKPVNIGLANGGFAEILDELGEVYTLTYAADERIKKEVNVGGQEELDVHTVGEYIATGKPLVELYPQQVKLQLAGAIAMVSAAVLFMVTGTLYTFTQSGALDVDAMVTTAKAGHIAAASDNPVWQLDRARADADQASKTVRTLKRDGKNWTWELAQ